MHQSLAVGFFGNNFFSFRLFEYLRFVKSSKFCHILTVNPCFKCNKKLWGSQTLSFTDAVSLNCKASFTLFLFFFLFFFFFFNRIKNLCTSFSCHTMKMTLYGLPKSVDCFFILFLVALSKKDVTFFASPDGRQTQTNNPNYSVS